MKLRHFFLPHSKTHKKAYLLRPQALLAYIALFIFMQVGFGQFGASHPGILGVATNINQQLLIQLTNGERNKNGLPPLKENSDLDAAAYAKGQNMFAENYWAHFAPSGKSPWDFIKSSGYNFSYAGENLARNFQNSDDVVNAWMVSPSHRENIVNTHYQDIGIAVVNGNLQGEETTLVVQEFGTPAEPLVEAPGNGLPQQVSAAAATPMPTPLVSPAGVPLPTSLPAIQPGAAQKPLVDTFAVTRNFGLFIISLLILLIALDWVIIKRRAVYRVASHHMPQLLILILVAVVLINWGPGIIR